MEYVYWYLFIGALIGTCVIACLSDHNIKYTTERVLEIKLSNDKYKDVNVGNTVVLLSFVSSIIVIFMFAAAWPLLLFIRIKKKVSQ